MQFKLVELKGDRLGSPHVECLVLAMAPNRKLIRSSAGTLSLVHFHRHRLDRMRGLGARDRLVRKIQNFAIKADQNCHMDLCRC